MRDLGARTEPATPRRRREARRDGQVARSADFASATTLAGGTLLGAGGAAWLFAALASMLADMLEHPHDGAAPTASLFTAAADAARLVGPALIAIWAIAALAAFGQVGPLMAPRALRPSLERIDPVRGAGRLFGARVLVRAGLDGLKIAGVVAVVVLSLRASMDAIAALPYRSVGAIAITLGTELLTLALRILAVLVAVGLLDLAYQRWRLGQDLRMTKQELKEEARQHEGDPEMRKRVRRRRQQHPGSALRRLEDIPRADVVIAGFGVAVAVAYEGDRAEAPRVLATARGPLARRIEALARKHDVPVATRPALARVIAQQLAAGALIPDDLYDAVAEALAEGLREVHGDADDGTPPSGGDRS
jgi:flagellar biosynthetic protein FlhB